MTTLYFCKTDPKAVGGVAEVARNWIERFGAANPHHVRPTLQEAEVIALIRGDSKGSPRFGHDFDVVHLWAGQFPLATLYARCLGIPVVLDRSSTHAYWQREVLLEEARRLQASRICDASPLVPKMEHVFSEMAEYEFSHVVVPCNFALETFNEAARITKRAAAGLSVVPTGIDAARFPFTERPEKFRVLFSGHNWFRKGLIYLWLAAKHIDYSIRPSISFDFNTGSEGPPPFQLPPIHPASYGFTNYPNGLFSPSRNVYAETSVAVLPTLEDALPLSIDEAMASGVPVITTPHAGSRVVDGKSGFIVPIRNFEAIADKLLYFYDNPSELIRMGKEARFEAERHGWEHYASALSKVYAEASP